MPLLFLLFIALPIVELTLLFKVGSAIGALPTIALVLLTGAAGVHILRTQSLRTLRRAQNRLQVGELPGQEIVEGFMISIGGALLLTPGFITDVVALLLLVPWTRRTLVRRLFDGGHIAAWSSQAGGFTFTRFGGGWPPQGGPGRRDIYEGEFTREDQANTRLDKPDRDSR